VLAVLFRWHLILGFDNFNVIYGHLGVTFIAEAFCITLVNFAFTFIHIIKINVYIAIVINDTRR